MRVLTHKNPDFDALAGCYIYCKETNTPFDNIDFVSVYDPQGKNCVYIDVTPLDNKDAVCFDHHKTARLFKTTTATELVWREYGSKPEYRPLIVEADIQDHCKDRKMRGLRLRDIWVATKSKMIKESSYSDRLFTERMIAMIDMLVDRESNLLKAYQEVEYLKVQYVETKNCKIAYYNGLASPYVGQYLFLKEEVDFVVYCAGNNIGITRNAERTTPDLQNFKPYIKNIVGNEIDEWFFHPEGFLCARGTYKNPVASPSCLRLDALVNTFLLFLRELGM